MKTLPAYSGFASKLVGASAALVAVVLAIPGLNGAMVLISNEDGFGNINALALSGMNTAMAAGTGSIAVGNVALTDAAIIAAGGSMSGVSTILSAFTIFGASTGTVSDPFYDIVGGVAKVGTAWGFNGFYDHNLGAAVGSLQGLRAYTVIGNAATLLGSTQLLVYKHDSTKVFDDASFPQTPAELRLTFNASGTLVLGTQLPPSITDGAWASEGFSAGTPYRLHEFPAIPEPSRALFAALGIALCGLRRRR